MYWLTLLRTLLISYSKPRASKFWDQAGRFYQAVWNFEKEFFWGLLKVQNYLKSHQQNTFSSTV